MDEAGKIRTLSPGAMAEQNAALERRNVELEALVAALRAENERLKLQQHRQAAPFRKETRVAQPKPPGRKPGQGTFMDRIAPLMRATCEPSVAVPVTASACPHRGGALVAEGPEVVSITELPEQARPVVRQPPGAPELNPAERVFEELRRTVEGRVYPTLADKVAAVERAVQALAADAARIRRLAGWARIHDALSPITD